MENSGGEPFNATLIERLDLTDVLSIVRVRPDSGRVPPFVPGQFIRLGLPRPAGDIGARPASRPGRIRYTRRAYSIASSPAVEDHLELFVVCVEEGALTPRLWELAVGDRLWMDNEAKGEFRLELAPPGKDLVMVATGTGIAPFVSMLRTFGGRGYWRRFVVIHGARRAADLGYRGEMEAAARVDAGVQYIPLVTREPADSGWTGLRGRVQDVLVPAEFERLTGGPLTPSESHIFLCGNPQMIDGTHPMLESYGFVADSRNGAGTIHFERYW